MKGWNEKDSLCVQPESSMLPFAAIALPYPVCQGWECLSALSLELPSWCSCRQLSDGPSLVCARENRPLCLSLWMIPLRPLTAWPMAGPSLVPESPAEVGPHLGTRCVQSGIASIWPGRDHPLPAGSCSLWCQPQHLGPFPQGCCCASPPQLVLGHSFTFLPWAWWGLFWPHPWAYPGQFMFVEVLPFPLWALFSLPPFSFRSPCQFAEGALCPIFWVLVSVWSPGMAPGVLSGQVAAGCSAAGCSCVIQRSGLFSRPAFLLFMELGALWLPGKTAVGDLSWSQRMFSWPFIFHQRPPAVGSLCPW